MKSYLFDTSFLIELADEIESGEDGPAVQYLATLPSAARVFVSPVTIAELLEGAEDPEACVHLLNGYHQTVIGWQAAKRCALNQSRAAQRMGENDAWQAAIAVVGGHTLVGRDRAFERRSWLDYHDFAKS